ncbi:TetR/AcrR family transcriptional regulator [Algoriphagus aquimarinus]|uniref:TetR/AcrR family transcriptional regulator n=1 Tax=Algoriphagus aquimarinus TaxID=237018 RepID=UPI0030D779C2|tara:strand:- start:186717 stop:187382 length:666 start_codon:yes stop_codon:yes gene_type:complete
MARKIPDGEYRNKERTKAKLVDAVGEIIRSEGYTKLGVNHIATVAGVSKKLIYRYFETPEKLIETYVRNKDYWMAFDHLAKELAEKHQSDKGREYIPTVLKNLYEHMYAVPETQKIILWEISEPSKLMQEICLKREKFGSEIFAMTDSFFENTSVDIRGICALLLGGIYYQTLHSNATGGTFCEIETDHEERKRRLFKSLESIINWAYTEADNQKADQERK